MRVLKVVAEKDPLQQHSVGGWTGNLFQYRISLYIISLTFTALSSVHITKVKEEVSEGITMTSEKRDFSQLSDAVGWVKGPNPKLINVNSSLLSVLVEAGLPHLEDDDNQPLDPITGKPIVYVRELRDILFNALSSPAGVEFCYAIAGKPLPTRGASKGAGAGAGASVSAGVGAGGLGGAVGAASGYGGTMRPASVQSSVIADPILAIMLSGVTDKYKDNKLTTEEYVSECLKIRNLHSTTVASAAAMASPQEGI
jgi:hypothetical protein